MELPALSAVLVDAILIKCPQYDRASVTVALESVFAGHPTLLGGNSISMLFGQDNDFRNATITIGDVHAGNQVHVTVTLPQPIDPLPAALAALASIPLKDVPKPRSDLPQSSRLPFESSPHFVGREGELKALAQAIGTAQPAVVMPAVATGLGGIGKTSLVTEFAYRYGVYFHGGVFWLNCADPDQVASQIAACAVGLKLDTTGLSLDEQVQRVLHAWQSPMPRLLIFDNCDDPAILTQWKPTVGGCRVLVTARSDQWPTLIQIRLGLLPPVESRLLLQRLCARLTDAEADAIAEDLGHLPLALHLAGSYLATYPHHTVEQYRKDLTIAHRSLKGRGALPSPTRHEQDVEATFMLSFNHLDPTNALDALALGMLDGTAWCAPGVPIPRDLVLAFVPDGTDADDAVNALLRLQQFGLLDGVDAVVLHRLLAQVVHARLGSTETLAVVEDRIAKTVVHSREMWIEEHLIILEPHLRYITMWAFDREDADSAILVNSLGLLESIRGASHEAANLYERALTVRKSLLGEDHPATAQSMNNLATALEAQGRYGEAQKLYEQVLSINTYAWGENHPQTATVKNNLAGVLAEQGWYGEAQKLYEQALVTKDSILGSEHASTLESMNNLAGVLAEQGWYGEAQKLYERVLAAQEVVLGSLHPTTIVTLNNLGTVLLDQAQYKEAQALFERAVTVQADILGTEHPDTLLSLDNLATTLMYQGFYEDAQDLYISALAIRERTLGMDHPSIATGVNNLAGVMAKQGYYEEAQKLYERALSIREMVFSLHHPLIAMSLNNLASVLVNQGNYEQARVLFERSLLIARSLGETRTTIDIQCAIGEILLAQNLSGFEYLAKTEQDVVEAGLMDEAKLIGKMITRWEALYLLRSQMITWVEGNHDDATFGSLLMMITEQAMNAIYRDQLVIRVWLADQLVILRRLPRLPLEGSHVFLGLIQAWLRNELIHIPKLEIQLPPVFTDILRQMRVTSLLSTNEQVWVTVAPLFHGVADALQGNDHAVYHTIIANLTTAIDDITAAFENSDPPWKCASEGLQAARAILRSEVIDSTVIPVFYQSLIRYLQEIVSEKGGNFS